MMGKYIFASLLFFATGFTFAQNEIPWDGKYQLQLSDFRSSATQIGNVNVYSIFTACGIDFTFAMSSVEFMFTKNFNSKVSNTFKRNSSSVVAPDTEIAASLVEFSQFQFDATELYARKFRKKIAEEKGSFSGVNFFRPFYDDIQKELSARCVNAGKDTDLGRKSEKLKQLHQDVLSEIDLLSDYCKDCKLVKKKS